MPKFKIFLLLGLIGVVGITGTTWAQARGPLFVLHPPDSSSSPPDVHIYASVLDPDQAQSIEGLGSDHFQVTESETFVSLTDVAYRPVGLAVVVVVDRGGISAPGDPRLKQATDLVRELVNRLSVTGAPEDDVIAIVCVGEGGQIAPQENFSYNPVDINLVLNALVAMEGEAVRGDTPLYNGLDEALRLIGDNPDKTIRDVLTHRRKIIVILSDGIDPYFFSDRAWELDVSIYAIGMARMGRQLNRDAENNLKVLAYQTGGLYQLHNSDQAHEEVLALFDRLMTQRNQYVLTYRTAQPKGRYPLQVMVNTDVGSAEKSVLFDSRLQPLQLTLTAPPDGLEMTVPYSPLVSGYAGTLTLSIGVTPNDGVSRYPGEVRYFANGVLIGGSTTAPNYKFSWGLGGLVSPSLHAPTQKYTIQAEADDPFLGTRLTSDTVNIWVRWEELPLLRRGLLWLSAYWWILLLLILMTIGLLVMLLTLLHIRSQLSQHILTGTTGVLRGMTRRLGAIPLASARLVVIKGANVGREIPLGAPVVKIARDPQFGDFALYDEFVSNPHFSIHQDQTHFYIMDEGSMNRTWVNGVPIPPHTRVVLQPDTFIEVGITQLQFKQIGGTTRQLEP